MTIPAVSAGQTIDPDWGNAVADSLNTFHAAGGSASVTGIAATDTFLPDADATLSLVVGQLYFVQCFVPLRVGVGATASITGGLNADGVEILSFNDYSTWVSNERLTVHAFGLYTPVAASVAFRIKVAISSSTMQTNAGATRLYGYHLAPIGT